MGFQDKVGDSERSGGLGEHQHWIGGRGVVCRRLSWGVMKRSPFRSSFSWLVGLVMHNGERQKGG
jgi:hypothetical protein